MKFSKEQLDQIKKDVSFLFETKISSYEEKLLRLSILEKFNQKETWNPLRVKHQEVGNKRKHIPQ